MTDHEALEALSKKVAQTGPITAYALIDLIGGDRRETQRLVRTAIDRGVLTVGPSLKVECRTGQLIPAPSVETVGEASGGGSGAVVGEAMSKTLRNALLASYDSVVPPMPSVDDAATCSEALARITALEASLAEAEENLRRVRNVKADHWRNVRRLAALTVSRDKALAEAEGRVIAEVVAWLRKEALKAWGADTSGMDETAFIATALETGAWKKHSPPPPTVV